MRRLRVLALALAVAGAAVGGILLLAEDGPARIKTGKELRAQLHGLASQDRVRELIGSPTRIQETPQATYWEYDEPFEIRVVFGPRGRLAWWSMMNPPDAQDLLPQTPEGRVARQRNLDQQLRTREPA
jgi:hypothetical protein